EILAPSVLLRSGLLRSGLLRSGLIRPSGRWSVEALRSALRSLPGGIAATRAGEGIAATELAPVAAKLVPTPQATVVPIAEIAVANLPVVSDLPAVVDRPAVVVRLPAAGVVPDVDIVADIDIVAITALVPAIIAPACRRMAPTRIAIATPIVWRNV